MAIPKLIHYSDNSYVTGQGTLFEGFETFSDWTKTAGDSIEADSIKTREGVLSLKLNSVNGAGTSADKIISKDLSAATNFIVWIYLHGQPIFDLHDIGTLNECIIRVSSVADWSKWFSVTLPGIYFKAGWNRMVVAKEQFSVYGAESWSNTMIRLRVNCSAKAGENVSVSFDDLRYNHAGKAKCIITFDDNYANVYDNAKPRMDTNGQAGVEFIVTDWVGGEEKLTKAQMITMQDDGWDISNHGKEHLRLTDVSQQEMEEDIDNGYDWLVDNGFSKGAKFFAYPYGAFNPAIITKVKERHRMARAIIGSYWEFVGNFQPHFNLNDNDDIEFLVKVMILDLPVDPPVIENWIDKTIIQKGLLIFVLHAVGPVEGKAAFETISDYLKTKEDAGLINVITFSDYYDQFMPSTLTSVVYLEHGAVVPYPITHEPSESVNRAEDRRIKVYKHPLAGDRKRIWRIKCIIDNSGDSGYKWRDLEYFYWKVVEGAKRRCVFVDANSIQYVVRIIGFTPKATGLNNKHEVTMILEEDYT